MGADVDADYRGDDVVGYQGRPGAFSESAAVTLVGTDVRLRPFDTFPEVFAALTDGRIARAVIPVDNSLVGPVPGIADLLSRHRVEVRAGCREPIVHTLIGVVGAEVALVREVRSHPVALAQCRWFFEKHRHVTPVPTFDTAGAVQEIVAVGDRRVAAIAGARAAVLYSGRVLLPRVADRADNSTRFVLVAPAGTTTAAPGAR